MKIYTHLNLDLDAVASVWAARKFIRGAKNATIVLVPANWDGIDMEEGDLALDIEAGEKGIKGERRPDGRVHSCFVTIVKQYANKNVQAALKPLIAFIDATDANGMAIRSLSPGIDLAAEEILWTTSLNGVLRALQAVHRTDEHAVIEKMTEIFDGMLQMGHAHRYAEQQVKRAKILPGGLVAVAHNLPMGTNAQLFGQGVKVIVFVDGNSLGAIRDASETFRVDDPIIREIVAQAGEAEEWYPHSSGFLYARGTRKAPVSTPSKVNPRKLAQAAARLLERKYGNIRGKGG